jgi:hypothetical protein
MDSERSKNITHEVRTGLTMLMRAVDDASDSNTVIKAALRDVLPGFRGEFRRHYEIAKANAMQAPMKQAFAQAGVLDKIIRMFEELRERRK